jgi:RNA polymerase sigma factor (sigma-70 family)
MRSSSDESSNNDSPVKSANNAQPVEQSEGILLDAASDPIFESDAQWLQVVEQIQRGDDAGMEELYRVFEHGIRFYFCRQLGIQELDDKVHDTFLIVVQAIRRGDLREPERLMGFVRTVVRRQVAACIDHIIQSRRDEQELEVGGRVADGRRDPEQSAAFQEKVAFMRGILEELCPKDRDILTRFYLHEESQEQICEEMHLSDTQFRLLKSRAKARFGGLGQRRLQQRPMLALFLRTSAGALH